MTTQQPINMPGPHGDPRFKCGGCQWFVQGFDGKTCQVTRLVQADTRACLEFQPFKQSPFVGIERDKFLVEMRRTMTVWTEVTIKKFEQEIKNSKIVSKKKRLEDPMAYVEEEKIAELGAQFEECQATLERILDIKFEIMDKCVELDSFAKDVKAYLFTQYRDHVQALSNESERGSFHRAAAPELFRALDKMDNLKKKAELAYDNLRSAHFALKEKQTAMMAIYQARIMSLGPKVKSIG